jgi:WD40 repeat protein
MRQAKIAVVMLAALLALIASTAPAVGSTGNEARGVRTASAVPGTQLWVSHYHGALKGFNLAASVAASPDGRVVFATGTSLQRVRGSGGRIFKRFVYATVAYNAATGAQMWRSRYATPGHGNLADAVAVSPDGDTVYVTGTTNNAPNPQHYTTVAYNAATGAQIWARQLTAGPGSPMLAASLAVGPHGSTVYVTGPTAVNSVNSVNGYTAVAYRAATGVQIWARRQAVHFSPIATSVAVSPTGRVVFVAVAAGSGAAATTVAYNAATGATVWSKQRGRFATGVITVAVSPDGGQVFVAWTTSSEGGPGPVVIVARNAATGAVEWISEGNGQLENSGSALAVSPDGSTVFVIMTQDFGSDGANSITTAYNAATGTPRWSVTFPSLPSTGIDKPSAVAVNPDGKSVYVTVNTYTKSFAPSSFTTISYSAATGAQLWASSHHQAGSEALSAAVSPDGNTVFAAGSSLIGIGLGMEYTTIAYRA